MMKEQWHEAEQAVVLFEEGTIVAVHAFNTVDERLDGSSSTLAGVDPLAGTALLLLAAIQSCPASSPEIRVKLLADWALVAGMINEERSANVDRPPF